MGRATEPNRQSLPSDIQFSPLSSLQIGPPNSGSAVALPGFACHPQEEDTNPPDHSHKAAGYWEGLTPKCLLRAVHIVQPSTDSIRARPAEADGSSDAVPDSQHAHCAVGSQTAKIELGAHSPPAELTYWSFSDISRLCDHGTLRFQSPPLEPPSTKRDEHQKMRLFLGSTGKHPGGHGH